MLIPSKQKVQSPTRENNECTDANIQRIPSPKRGDCVSVREIEEDKRQNESTTTFLFVHKEFLFGVNFFPFLATNKSKWNFKWVKKQNFFIWNTNTQTSIQHSTTILTPSLPACAHHLHFYTRIERFNSIFPGFLLFFIKFSNQKKLFRLMSSHLPPYKFVWIVCVFFLLCCIVKTGLTYSHHNIIGNTAWPTYPHPFHQPPEKVYPFVLINWLLLKRFSFHLIPCLSSSPIYLYLSISLCVCALIRLPNYSKYRKCLLFQLFSVCSSVCPPVWLPACMYVSLFVFMSLLICSLALPSQTPHNQPLFYIPSLNVCAWIDPNCRVFTGFSPQSFVIAYLQILILYTNV